MLSQPAKQAAPEFGFCPQRLPDRCQIEYDEPDRPDKRIAHNIPATSVTQPNWSHRSRVLRTG
jgi:hypothetical protein